MNLKKATNKTLFDMATILRDGYVAFGHWLPKMNNFIHLILMLAFNKTDNNPGFRTCPPTVWLNSSKKLATISYLSIWIDSKLFVWTLCWIHWLLWTFFARIKPNCRGAGGKTRIVIFLIWSTSWKVQPAFFLVNIRQPFSSRPN